MAPGQIILLVVAWALYIMVNGWLVLFVNIAPGIDVVPKEVAPEIPAGIEAVHDTVEPGEADERLTRDEVEPEQSIWSGIENWTVGLGLIVIW